MHETIHNELADLKSGYQSMIRKLEKELADKQAEAKTIKKDLKLLQKQLNQLTTQEKGGNDNENTGQA